MQQFYKDDDLQPLLEVAKKSVEDAANQELPELMEVDEDAAAKDFLLTKDPKAAQKQLSDKRSVV